MILVEYQPSTRIISMKPCVTAASMSEVMYSKYERKHCGARRKSRKKSGLYTTLQWIKSAFRKQHKQRLKTSDFEEL